MIGAILVAPGTPSAGLCTLPLHDALPIWWERNSETPSAAQRLLLAREPDFLPYRSRIITCELQGRRKDAAHPFLTRSEEHTSELQSRPQLVCRRLLEKKNRAEAEQ